jgi:hypothetical protein
METMYFIVNKNDQNSLVGGHDYGSIENAKNFIGTTECNISEKDAQVQEVKFDHLNDVYVHPENYINNNPKEVLRLLN